VSAAHKKKRFHARIFQKACIPKTRGGTKALGGDMGLYIVLQIKLGIG
jgi:hypothetical protein